MNKLVNKYLKDNSFSLDDITESKAKKIVLFAISQFLEKNINFLNFIISRSDFICKFLEQK